MGITEFTQQARQKIWRNGGDGGEADPAGLAIIGDLGASIIG